MRLRSAGPVDAGRGRARAVARPCAAGAPRIDGLLLFATEVGIRDVRDLIRRGSTGIVRIAHDLSHFEVPRSATPEDVAAELDIDPSTVGEHLRRAQANLMDHLLGGAED